MNLHSTYIFSIVLGLILMLSLPLKGQIVYKREYSDLYSYIDRSLEAEDQKRIKVGLVLSGGGARGITHIGVLRGFEKYNIPIDLIVGTSMGSVIGGFYAAGVTVEQLDKSIRNINWDDIFSDATERQNLFVGQKAINDRYLLSLRFDGMRAFIPSSLTSGQKILSIITDELYKTKFPAVNDFDDLKIPFRAITTDLISGERLVIGKGDLAEAINASVAIPLLFSPVVWDDKWLVDGGLSTNYAVDEARSLGMDVVIVVDNSSPLRKRDELQAPWEIADQVTTIMMRTKNEEQIQMADLVIKPDITDVSSSDFNKIDDMIIQGEKAVDRLALQLYDLTEKRKTPKIYYKYDEFKIILNDVEAFDIREMNLFADNADSITQDMIQQDIDNIFSLGFYQSAKASVFSAGNQNQLIYSLKKYNVLDTVMVEDNTVFPDSTILDLIKYKSGQALNFNMIQRGLSEVKQLYRDQGYALIGFREVEYDPVRRHLVIKVDEGIIAKFEVEGNQISNDFIILREFPLNKNEIYNSKAVKQGIDNIYNTQLFDKVSVNLNRENGKNVLIIKVVEKKYLVLRLGGKAGTERGAQVYAEWEYENFLGNAYKVYLTGRYGEMDRLLGFNYRADRVFESLLTVSLKAYYDWKRFPYFAENDKIGEYREVRKGAKFGIGLQLQKLGQISVELRLENVKNDKYSGNFTEDEEGRINNNSELRTISVKSVTDKRDNIAFTRSGVYNIWFWETANKEIVQGQEKYSKVYVNLEGYYTYWTYHTFHFRGLIGIGDKTLPFSEWFRIGGLNDFMGLHQYQYFGRQVIQANFEYRFFIPFESIADIYLGLRYDIGGIWESPDLVLKSEDFFTGIGGWLGFNTLLGPVYLGYGDTSNKAGIFYLSIGYDF